MHFAVLHLGLLMTFYKIRHKLLMNAKSFRGTKITQGHYASHSVNKHFLEMLETGDRHKTQYPCPRWLQSREDSASGTKSPHA